MVSVKVSHLDRVFQVVGRRDWLKVLVSVKTRVCPRVCLFQIMYRETIAKAMVSHKDSRLDARKAYQRRRDTARDRA